MTAATQEPTEMPLPPQTSTGKFKLPSLGTIVMDPVPLLVGASQLPQS